MRYLFRYLVANYRYTLCLGECGGGILLSKLVEESEQIAHLITDRRENEQDEATLRE